MTYRERSSVKCVLSRLRFNESTAQRHNRIGYWSNVPQEVLQIRPRSEPLEYLKRHPRSRLASSTDRVAPLYVPKKKNAPVQTPGHRRRMTGAIGLQLCETQPDFHHAW
jgi:hypothetical protein